MSYFTAELQNAASMRKAEPCKAKTLAGAKRVATQRQTFQGTTLAVYDSQGFKIAIKTPGDGWFSMPDESALNCAPDINVID